MDASWFQGFLGRLVALSRNEIVDLPLLRSDLGRILSLPQTSPLSNLTQVLVLIHVKLLEILVSVETSTYGDLFRYANHTFHGEHRLFSHPLNTNALQSLTLVFDCLWESLYPELQNSIKRPPSNSFQLLIEDETILSHPLPKSVRERLHTEFIRSKLHFSNKFIVLRILEQISHLQLDEDEASIKQDEFSSLIQTTFVSIYSTPSTIQTQSVSQSKSTEEIQPLSKVDVGVETMPVEVAIEQKDVTLPKQKSTSLSIIQEPVSRHPMPKPPTPMMAVLQPHRTEKPAKKPKTRVLNDPLSLDRDESSNSIHESVKQTTLSYSIYGESSGRKGIAGVGLIDEIPQSKTGRHKPTMDKRRKWEKYEDVLLQRGIRRHGKKWADIAKDADLDLDRTDAQIKDRYRILSKDKKWLDEIESMPHLQKLPEKNDEKKPRLSREMVQDDDEDEQQNDEPREEKDDRNENEVIDESLNIQIDRDDSSNKMVIEQLESDQLIDNQHVLELENEPQEHQDDRSTSSPLVSTDIPPKDHIEDQFTDNKADPIPHERHEDENPTNEEFKSNHSPHNGEQNTDQPIPSSDSVSTTQPPVTRKMKRDRPTKPSEKEKGKKEDSRDSSEESDTFAFQPKKKRQGKQKN
ncbi:hypothetical protein BLNAU_22642 [Blattamonas nauphoetae]|uniref:Myb-like domain-containing protein n=1 Tax=Blattamonas nauphoetae TaxID=2049346 RepID=A0ABQ9WSH6_9EUKA|nr:hypothetical protein BLNAU_22642 [Blattamonas nauphoetae]